MKKTLLLSGLAMAGALSIGCAATDYGASAGLPTLNKTHGIIGCESSDRFANSQQTIEPLTRDLLYTAVDPATGDTICSGLVNASVTSENVDRQDARDWQRFNGPYAFLQEVLDITGTWVQAGVKDMPNGDIRITNYYSENNAGNFTCVGSSVSGRYGGPEGVIAGDGYANPGEASARIPGFGPDLVAIDRSPGTSGFCANIAAVSSGHAPAGSFTSLTAYNFRVGEGQVHFSPVTRRAEQGLAQFLSGGSMTAEYLGVTGTGHAGLLEDGRIELFVDSLSKDGVTYEATDDVRFIVNPANNFRTIEVDVPQSERVALARFAIDAGMTDRVLAIGGFVPEVGVMVPDAEVMLSGDALRMVINGELGGPIDG